MMINDCRRMFCKILKCLFNDSSRSVKTCVFNIVTFFIKLGAKFNESLRILFRGYFHDFQYYLTTISKRINLSTSHSNTPTLQVIFFSFFFFIFDWTFPGKQPKIIKVVLFLFFFFFFLFNGAFSWNLTYLFKTIFVDKMYFINDDIVCYNTNTLKKIILKNIAF